MPPTNIRLAIRGLTRHKVRTILTMLGMIIGVAAVMTMVALGNGAQQSVEQEVRAAGTSVIHVNAGNYTIKNHSFDIGDAIRLNAEITELVDGIAVFMLKLVAIFQK